MFVFVFLTITIKGYVHAATVWHWVSCKCGFGPVTVALVKLLRTDCHGTTFWFKLLKRPYNNEPASTDAVQGYLGTNRKNACGRLTCDDKQCFTTFISSSSVIRLVLLKPQPVLFFIII